MSEQRMMESSSYGGVMAELDARATKRERDRRKQEFDDKIIQLADKAIEFTRTRGADDNLTVLLVSFLDVALEMQNLMETMTAINVAMECISDAIGFLDAAIDFDNKLIQESLGHDYGLIARWKQRRQMKKAIRNNVGRMTAIADGLMMKYTMATKMMEALSTVGVKLKGTMAKVSAKKAKKAKKSGEPVSTGPSAAQLFIAERMKATGEKGAGDDVGVPSAPSSSSGIDDIV